MSPSQGMRAWGAGVSAGHLLLGALGWLLLGVPPYFFAGCAVVTLGGALLAAPLLSPRGDDDGDDDGGGGPSGPDDGEPPWWPEFEREFREYAGRRHIFTP
jgi:hypothetical protein